QVASWFAVACYVAGIWWLSSQGAQITARVDAASIPDFYAHLVLFGGLSLLVRLALWSSWPHQSELWLGGLAAGVVFGYGIVDEIHQHFVPGRGTDVQDLLGDLAGAISGQVLVGVGLWVWRLAHGAG
ncbi:MAG: VanZ family protein, partial [Armatimonadetes bacterium]|nr:VanZ family protein [Armatimonadota bacterium]